MANCKPVYGNKYIIDKLETGCLKVNNKLVDKNNQPLVRWFLETENGTQTVNSNQNGTRTVNSNETVKFVSSTIDIRLSDEKDSVIFETRQQNSSYTSIQMNSNTTCLVPQDCHLVQIQVAVVDCTEDVVVELVVDDNVVRQYTLPCIPSEQNQRSLYLNYIGEPLVRGQILRINSLAGAEFILYLGANPNTPLPDISRAFVFETTPENGLFYQSNITDVLDDIFT
jgi:hypothetical protein